MRTELLNLLIGTLSILPIIAEKLLRIPKHMFAKLPGLMKPVLTVFVVAGLLASFITQGSQYVHATTSNDEMRRIERDYARVLFLYSEKKGLDWADRLLKDNQYVAGYKAFKSGRNAMDDGDFSKAMKYFDEAKPHLLQSIADKRFTPQSHYVLASIALSESGMAGDGDLSKAMDEVEQSIRDDKDYMAPYYLRGILEVRTKDAEMIPKALNDLERAAMSDRYYSEIICGDLQKPDEIDKWWKTLANNKKFRQIQSQCKVKWGLT